MIPLVDDYIQMFLVNRIRYLRDNPVLIDMIFQTGRRESLKRLKDFIAKQKIRVVIGYPREQSILPAYVITLAPEGEQPGGLGDNSHTYGSDMGLGEDIKDTGQDYLDDLVASTMMNSNYRIECWSDNGDLTAYMYIILKWCIWSSRKEMLSLGWNNIRLEGTDLEPVPDYMPVFIYRRVASVSITYDALYHEDLDRMGVFLDVISNPDGYERLEDGSIVNKETGMVAIPATCTWIINQYVHTMGNHSPAVSKTTYTFKTKAGVPTVKNQEELPPIGEPDVLYLVHQYLSGEYDYYKPCIWDDELQQFIPISQKTSKENKYRDIIIVNASNKEG